MDLKDYFSAVGEQLKAEVIAARATLGHAGNKGARSEQAFRNFLRSHLPRSFDVGHGEIIDRYGFHAGSIQIPGQLDVIVFDESHPRFVQPDNPGLYLFEGVVAASEVKMSLQLGDAKSIILKAANFKKLKQSLGRGDFVISNEEDLQRFVNRRPYFLFAFSSSTPLEKFYERMCEIENDENVDPTGHLDGIFFLDRGALINVGKGGGQIGVLLEDGERATGWCVDAHPVMVSLIAWLSAVTPKITHHSAILPRYLMRSLQEIEAERSQE